MADRWALLFSCRCMLSTRPCILSQRMGLLLRAALLCVSQQSTIIAQHFIVLHHIPFSMIAML